MDEMKVGDEKTFQLRWKLRNGQQTNVEGKALKDALITYSRPGVIEAELDAEGVLIAKAVGVGFARVNVVLPGMPPASVEINVPDPDADKPMGVVLRDTEELQQEEEERHRIEKEEEDRRALEEHESSNGNNGRRKKK